MSDVDELKVYEGSEDLVDMDVVRKTAHLWQRGTVIFYAQKRHFLEVIPELVVSFWLIFSLLAIVYMVQPWELAGGTDLGGIVIATLICFSPLLYFLFEIIRWNRDFLILNSYGLYHRWFDFRSADWKNRLQNWAPESEVSVPISYKMSNIDVGTLYLEGIGGIKRTPAIKSPHRLHGLIAFADNYLYTNTDDPDWRE